MILKIVLGIVLLLVLAVVVILIAAMTRPNQFSYARSMKMAAPPEVVFPHVNNLQKWEAWSPWEKLDPNMKKTYGDTVEGEGAYYAWNGDGNVGAGAITIAESQPYEKIKMDLKILRPFACENDVFFTFASDGDQTNVTWRMDGKNNFMAKVTSLFMNFEEMCGNQFTEGLESLKQITEEEVKQASPGEAGSTS
ncbi:SRPBCC family protein [Blastopirellula retiformator]|uniref:Polyketide cyclase / dehydrase and lipid transport n=1 Tax=Blastopirellula retiformator TaxID=2527970 RepID=A0A5C5V0W0_9BACT|nr:SRPBCC family protein [Blastopirellula retiformator]TWT31372.1 Polyketide cyclase / dehydrase and lipid transport [Blastopirellula retiformator]